MSFFSESWSSIAICLVLCGLVCLLFYTTIGTAGDDYNRKVKESIANSERTLERCKATLASIDSLKKEFIKGLGDGYDPYYVPPSTLLDEEMKRLILKAKHNIHRIDSLYKIIESRNNNE